MTIIERAMRPGRWSLPLDPQTPRDVRIAVQPGFENSVDAAAFSQLVITPVPVHLPSVTDAGLLAMAMWSGIYHALEGGLTMVGESMASTLGDSGGDGGDVLEASRTYTGTSMSSIAAEVASRAGLLGLTTIDAGSYTGTHRYVALRDVLDQVCASLGFEWRVRPDMRLQVGRVANLYAGAPRLLILDDDEGRSFDWIGVRGTLKPSVDFAPWRQKMVYITDAEAGVHVSVERNRTLTMPNGEPLVRDAKVEAHVTDGNPTSLAWAELGKHTVDRSWEVSVDSADVALIVQVGQPVSLWAPSEGLWNTGNQTHYRGRTIFPDTSRLMGMEWSPPAGLGVYLRRKASPSAAATYLDLSRYYVPGSGAARLEIGSTPRGLW